MAERVAPKDLEALLAQRSVVLCCGSGGVGKTTTSAALGLRAAQMGRKACVVTIDPARRLADALGLGELSNEPHKVDGPWPGELWAMMLDPKSTFDELVEHYSDSPEQAKGILQNRLYRNLASSLSGTQEYMASEKLYELYERDEFDLIIVDTPPSRNALDFLEAPGRLTALLENRIFRVLVTPAKGYLKVLSLGIRTFLRTVSSLVGSEVIEDVIAFFRAFEGMDEGFRERAERVRSLLADPGTSFLLVTSPREESATEAHWFADRLAETGLAVEGLIINRAHPRFAEEGLDLSPLAKLPTGSEVLAENLSQLSAAAAHEDHELGDLSGKVRGEAKAKVPLLAGDVHNLAGLEEIVQHLFA